MLVLSYGGFFLASVFLCAPSARESTGCETLISNSNLFESKSSPLRGESVGFLSGVPVVAESVNLTSWLSEIEIYII